MVKSFLGQISVIGYAFIPTTWIFIVYSLINPGKDLSKKTKILLLTIPIFSVIIALTNPWTGWFYSNITVPNPGFYQLQLFYTPNFAQEILYLYNTLITISVIFSLLKELIYGNKIYKNSYILTFITSIIALIICLMTFTSVYPGFSWGLLAYLTIYIILVVDIFLYGAFEVIPIVNENVIKELDVGILFFNNENKLFGLNPVIKELGINNNDLKSSVGTVFKNKVDILDFYYDEDQKTMEFLKNDKWYEINKTIMLNEGHKFGTILSFNDVTNRVYEINQKDLLVKEVHHRVKNNLQIILSLLNLDLRFNSDNPMGVIEDTRLRLNYMATLHEKLYSSSSDNEINIGEYLPDIACGLFNMYNSSIDIQEDIEDVMIDLDLAVSLGLILTEIINNTIKYAFSNKNGTFYIKFKSNNDKGVLDLYDDGVGLPENFSFEDSTGLGMTVIKSVTTQIEGEISIVPDKGTHFRIIFSLIN